MEKALWNAMLDADMNVRYWRCLAQRYTKRDRYIKIFLALSSSGTVASWAFWSEWSLVWKILSGLSAAIATASPILNYPGLVESLSFLSGKWWDAKKDYENYWTRYESGESPDQIQKEFYQTKSRETELVRMENKLPYNKRLLKRCQKEVLTSRGLISA
jgi:hypothetical protein